MTVALERLLLFIRINGNITMDKVMADLKISGSEAFDAISFLLDNNYIEFGEDDEFVSALSIDELNAKLAQYSIFYDFFTDDDLDYFAKTIKKNIVERLFELQFTTGMTPEEFMETDNKSILARVEVLRKLGVVINVDGVIRCALSPEDLRKLKAKQDATEAKASIKAQFRHDTLKANFKGLPFAEDEEE